MFSKIKLFTHQHSGRLFTTASFGIVGIVLLTLIGVLYQLSISKLALIPVLTPTSTATTLPTNTATVVPTHVPTYTATPYIPVTNGYTKLRQENHVDYVEVDFLIVRSIEPFEGIKGAHDAVKWMERPVLVRICVVGSDNDKMEIGNVSPCPITFWVNAEKGD